jgi:alanine-glyoxylate transaminase/serine-glyoxylate transaminase/serine-pyruvate transaminase
LTSLIDNSSSASFLFLAPVQLIYALETSLKTIMEGKVSLEERFKMHRETSTRFKNAMKDMGFKLVGLGVMVSKKV